jgi:hypothetical protein
MSRLIDVDSKEYVASLFQHDEVLAAEYYGRHKRRAQAMPEKVLMLAILEDAVCCFQKFSLARGRRSKSCFEESKRWIFDDDVRWIFSFRNVCDALEMDADYLRSGLLQWREGRLSLHTNGKANSVRRQRHAGGV